MLISQRNVDTAASSCDSESARLYVGNLRELAIPDISFSFLFHTQQEGKANRKKKKQMKT